MNEPQAIGYVRVSSKEQVEGTSLEQQKIAIEKYCDSNNFNLIKIFVERGESAKTADRTEFKEAINFVYDKENRVDYFIVHKVDRFARNAKDFHAIKAVLSKKGVDLKSVTENFDDDPAGRLMEGMLALIAQFDNEIRTERVTSGMRAKLEKGEFIFRPPPGYTKINKNSKNEILADKRLFTPIKTAWEMLLTGRYQSTEIVRWLNNNGFGSSREKKMSKQKLSKIFHNKFYAGIIEIESMGIRSKGEYEPMITEKEFYLAQEILEKQSQNTGFSHQENNSTFPLSRILYCRNCRKKLTGGLTKGRSKKYPYYQCWNPNCQNKDRFDAEVANALIEPLLNNMKFESKWYKILKEMMLENHEVRLHARGVNIDKLEKDLIVLKARLKKVEDMVEAGIYSIEKGKVRADEIKKELILKEVNLDKEKTERYKIEPFIDFFEVFSNQLYRLWVRCPEKQKREIFDHVFKKGVYFNGKELRTAHELVTVGLLRDLRDGCLEKSRERDLNPRRT